MEPIHPDSCSAAESEEKLRESELNPIGLQNLPLIADLSVSDRDVSNARLNDAFVQIAIEHNHVAPLVITNVGMRGKKGPVTSSSTAWASQSRASLRSTAVLRVKLIQVF